jgi:aldehyde dehydrogenase (NAD+)
MTDTATRTAPTSGLADDVRSALEACGVDLSVVGGDPASTTAVASPITGEPLVGARLDTVADIDAAIGRARPGTPRPRCAARW